jgi:hypothetical protein
MQEPGVVWPWLLATVVFLVMLGGGRTVRGRWLGRPPFAAGVALSVALGVMLLSLDSLLLGQLGALRSPWPQALLAIAVLVALPGLFWTVRDFRHATPGRGRGFGLGWLGPAAWLLLIAALVFSAVWITGAFGWAPRGLLFERVGVDYEIGRVAFDSALPRDPFLGSEPLGLFLYALGSAEASLALAWWLGVALLFGAYGLGCRLHARGAGLVAALALGIVLFATDRPLLLAPALPAAVALLAIMIVAVESRGRPNVAHSLVAGTLGGFALISDLGAAAMLLPLLVFGPFWCKFATGRELRAAEDVESDEPAEEPEEEAREPIRGREVFGRDFLEGEGDDDYIKFGEDEKSENGKKWLTPLKHTAIGVAGLSVPLVPWLARNDAWTDDPLYGFHDSDRIEYAERFRTDPSLGYDLKVDYRFLPDETEEKDEPLYEPYLDATEWGLGLGIATGAGLFLGDRRRRWQTLLYGAPAVLGYGLGAKWGDFDLTTPSAVGLLSVTAGSAVYTTRKCGRVGRNVSFGTAFVTGSLAVGLSGASDLDYWKDKPIDDWTPSVQLSYRYYDDWQLGAGYRFSDDYQGAEPKIQLKYDTPKLGLGLRYDYTPPAEEGPSSATPEAPTVTLEPTPATGYGAPETSQDESKTEPEAEPPPTYRPQIQIQRPRPELR